MSPSRFHNLAFGIIVLIGVLLYGRTLSFPFVFDDHIYLVQNPLVKDARSFTYNGDFRTFATHSARLGLDPDLSTNFILRPMTYLTFYINYTLNGLNPSGFRAVNIAIHCANAMLVLLLLSHLFRLSPKAGSLSPFSARFIALATALLFLVHPLQTESVTYIIQRFTSLATFFYLLTILAHLHANAAEQRVIRWSWRGLSVAALVAGMLSKESVFTAPFVLVLVDTLVMGRSLRMAAKQALPLFLCLPILPALLVATSWAQNNGQAGWTAALHIATAIKDPNYQWHYALTQLNVILSYLQMILVPRRQNLDYDHPLYTSLWQEQVWMSAAVIAVILVGAWLLYRQRREDVRRALLFCSALWYFVTLMPSSSLAPLGDLMAEHRCYLATIGALAALTCGADMWRLSFGQARWMRYVVPGCVAVWILGLGAVTWARNNTWKTEVAIWRDTANKSPGKTRPWINLGAAYVENGNIPEGVACFRKALRIDPQLIPAYENLSATENALCHYREALTAANTGLQFAPNSHTLYYNQGVARGALGQVEGAVRSFKKSIKAQPAYWPSQLSLAMCYAMLQKFDKALKHAQVAASLAPDNPRVRQTLGQIKSMAPQ